MVVREGVVPVWERGGWRWRQEGRVQSLILATFILFTGIRRAPGFTQVSLQSGEGFI